MKTVQMLRVFTKSSNIIIILLLVLSQFGWGATRAAADAPKKVMSAHPAAVTLTVTNTDDSGPGSLRDTIASAGADDTISFDPALSGMRGLSIYLASTLILAKNVTIDGSALVNQITISGDTDNNDTGDVGIFHVNSGVTVTLNNLRIQNGNSGTNGGGIYNDGTLNITNSGLYANSTSGNGGGIFNSSTGALTITNSTFWGNNPDTGSIPTNNGGGIYNDGVLNITNSTFSGNQAIDGGGIYNNGGSASTITNSTFSDNTARDGLGVGMGSGINNNGGTVTLYNTIVANSAWGENCAGAITNGGNNIDDGTTCGWGSALGSMSSTNPLLGSFRPNSVSNTENGGPTETMPLLTGSPAIDAVTFNAPNGAPATDQRGVARPFGARYDIGAYERNPQSGPTFVVNTNGNGNSTVCEYAPGNCSLREALDAVNALTGAGTITFNPALSGLSIYLDSTLILSHNITIDASGLAQPFMIEGDTDGNREGDMKVRVLHVNSSVTVTLNNLVIGWGKSDTDGGGIYNDGALTITNSSIQGNSAGVGYSGGGIFNSSSGSLFISNSTFSHNTSGNDSGGGPTHNNGGGIFNEGTLSITNSTFSGNHASGGGGIQNYGGTATITNSTFSDNSANPTGGGGIYNYGGTVALLNTIVANDSSGGNCGGAITNGGNNLDDGTTCGWGADNGSMSNTNPGLGSLGDNGGPTETMSLPLGSPAIDGVTYNAPNGAPATDQRGVGRPQGARYDIGAFEAPPPPPPFIHAFYLKASAAGDWVHAYGWQDGDPLTLVVDRPLVNGDVDYTTTVNTGVAPWNASSPVADILGIFDLGGLYNLQPGDELTVTGAGHTETYTVPAAMTSVRWFIGLGAGSDPGQIPAEQQVVDDFNTTHPNIELIAEVQPNPSARDTLVAEIAAGNPPDIVGPVGWDASGPFHGQWLDLAALISSTGFDTSIFNPEMVQAYQTDEGQVGLPFTVFPAAIFYQKSMFDAAGLHYPPAAYGNLYEMPDHSMVAWNFNTLTQVARLLTLDASGKNPTQAGFDKDNIVQYGYIPQWQQAAALASFWGADTLYSGTPGNYTALIPSQWDAAWRWYYDGMWGNQPFIPNGPVASSQEFGWSNVFNSGKVAMAQVEAWYTCCINEAGSNWDLAALPAYNGTVHNVVHADTFRILRDASNPDESFTVMAYLLTDGVAKLIPAYDAMPGRTSDQAAYFAGRSTRFPWVTNWQVLQAGLNYPDIPNNEAWMPNFNEARNRVNSFGNLMADSVGLNMSVEIAALQADLQNIFNANSAPVISDITNQVTDEDSPTGAIAFTIGDAEMPVLSLTVTASSSNPALLPNANIIISGTGANRAVTLIPVANQNGAATVTVSVHDGVTTTSDTFVLTVNAVNDAPTLSPIDNQSIDKNTSTSAIAFSVGDIETAAASLVVTASSSNTTLLPNGNITLGGSGANRTISLTPAADQSGAATITVTVSDGSASVSSTFALSVNALNNLPTISQVLPQQGLSSAPNDITIYGANFAEGVIARLGTTDLQTLRLGVGQLRATVPQGLATGVYALTVTNPGGASATLSNAYTVLPNAVDDLYGYAYELWSDPSALRAGQAGQIGLVVHRQGGQNPLSNVVVRFFLGDPAAGGTLLGNGSIPLLSPRGAQTTSGVNWTPAAAGEYTIYAIIDPDHLFNETLESNNVISRAVTILPAAGDQLAPHVDSFVVNDGASSITNLTVSLDTVASDTGGSGVASLQFVQYQYSAAADLWAPVQNSGWLDYATAQSNYAWNLAPANGVIYLQAWAMDHAGNVSIYPYGAYVSYLPPSESVAADQVHIYRYELSAGQSMTVRVTPISGDPDLYIWAPDYATRPPWVSNLNSGLVEEISFNAPVAGTYQIEVYGYTAAEYSITVTLSAGPASHTTLAGPNASNKSTYTQPYVPLESEPGNHYVAPPVEPSAFLIYLPLVMR